MKKLWWRPIWWQLYSIAATMLTIDDTPRYYHTRQAFNGTKIINFLVCVNELKHFGKHLPCQSSVSIPAETARTFFGRVSWAALTLSSSDITRYPADAASAKQYPNAIRYEGTTSLGYCQAKSEMIAQVQQLMPRIFSCAPGIGSFLRPSHEMCC